MSRFTGLVPILALLLVSTACSQTGDGNASEPPGGTLSSSMPPPEVEATSEGAAATQLEGTWSAEVTEDAFAAAIAAIGQPEEVGHEVYDAPGPEFRLEFLGDRFQLSYEPTGEPFQSGTFALEGGRIVLDDEAPVELISFAVEVDGDSATFTDGSATDAEEMAPGIPDYLPAVGFWSADTWVRTAD